jgi:hypothetical protein
VEHEHHRDQRNDGGNDAGVALPEEELALEHFRDPPHGVFADENGRDERHVPPHEKTKE